MKRIFTPIQLFLQKLSLAGQIALLIGVMGLSVAAATILTTVKATPSDTSAEAGFARDMITHHAQAVEMAFIIRDNTTDQTVRIIGFDIINTQSVQQGMMSAWLALWGLPQTTTRPPMSWIAADKMNQIHHEVGIPNMEHTALMPGMATEADMQKLRAARGIEAETLFLQLMIHHHKGGVQMAQAVLDLTKREEVRTLAQTILNSQQAEIADMQKLLEARGVLLHDKSHSNAHHHVSHIAILN